jgi:hypothetical protein
MEKMKMKKKTAKDWLEIAECVQRNFNYIQNYFAQHGGVLYVVDGKHRFLDFDHWMWNLHDRSEITELLDELQIMDRPRRVAKCYIVCTLCDCLGRKNVLPVRTLPAPFLQRPGSTLPEYREDLRQYLQNKYYPINPRR